MKKFILLLILLSAFFTMSASAAPRPQDDRRIEEQKRGKLKSTQDDYSPEPAQKPKSSPLQPNDIIYIAELSSRSVTFGYDLAKLIVILKQVENEYIDLASQIDFLKEQNLLPKRLHDTFDPMQPLRRGVTAYCLRKVLNIKGGVFLRIFKDSERYSMKELSHAGIMPTGNIHEIITGDELSVAFTNTINFLGAQ